METRTIEEQLKLKLCTEKLKNNVPRPNFTGSYKKKACIRSCRMLFREGRLGALYRQYSFRQFTIETQHQ